MDAVSVIIIVVLVLLFLWAIGGIHVNIQAERFNNMQPVDFHASMLNKYQDYVYDNLGMKNRDYQLEGLLHTWRVCRVYRTILKSKNQD